jgi:hypothetical protein
MKLGENCATSFEKDEHSSGRISHLLESLGLCFKKKKEKFAYSFLLNWLAV